MFIIASLKLIRIIMNTNTILSMVVAGVLFSTTVATANDTLVNVPAQDIKRLQKNAPKFAKNEVIISFKEGKGFSSRF